MVINISNVNDRNDDFVASSNEYELKIEVNDSCKLIAACGICYLKPFLSTKPRSKRIYQTL
jgi:hypothetical protein